MTAIRFVWGEGFETGIHRDPDPQVEITLNLSDLEDIIGWHNAYEGEAGPRPTEMSEAVRTFLSDYHARIHAIGDHTFHVSGCGPCFDGRRGR